ncbi:MAG TPA: YceI family protein [Pirellulales bacterium]|nr:YceI family protein [Pirellulales bacterium]
MLSHPLASSVVGRGSAALAVCLALAAFTARAADEYEIDAMHASVTFKASHLGLSWTHGRFNQLSGGFNLSSKSPSFSLTIKADSIDTNNSKRDDHLRSPDFLDVKQFPTITFKSTSAHKTGDSYEIEGKFTMHGVTKPLKFKLIGGETAEFPKGVERTGFSTELTIARSAYGMDQMLDAIADDVHIEISFEGTKKK